MKVFVFSTHTLWPHHAETELEIMQKHLDAGDTIYRIVCKGEMPVCDTNLTHRMHGCLMCVDKQVIGQGLLDGSEKIIKLPIYNSNDLTRAREYPFDFTDIKLFKEYKIDNFDIGYAVCSSVISALRDPEPKITDHLEFFRNYFYTSLAIYFSALRYIDEHKPDLIYAFNGRVAHAKPILRAAQKNKVECHIHERGCDIYHYSITVNTTPHDIDDFNKRMQRQWAAADPIERERTGALFFEERVIGKEQGWVSFVKEQEKDLLPSDWNASRHNIAIFNTSEDEYESIGPEWKNYLYQTQAEGIEKILKSFEDKKDYHFYLRIHPNLKGLKNKQITDAYALAKYSNLTIIDSDSPVSTYTLMNNCEKIITFGSSTGIEATYWGKISILLGKSFYYYLDVAYIPMTHEENVKLISSDLVKKDKAATLIYGYYFKTFGERFRFYKPTGFLSGTFKGKDLDKVEGLKTKILLSLYKIGFVKKIYHSSKRSISTFLNMILKW